jgi:hypothetical protein
VNTLAPGATETPIFYEQFKTKEEADARKEMFKQMTQLGRIGRPEEMAKAILLLGSDESSNTTGADLVADGGFTQLRRSGIGADGPWQVPVASIAKKQGRPTKPIGPSVAMMFSIELEFGDSSFVPQHTVAGAVGDHRHAVNDLQWLLEQRHRPVHIFQPMPARRRGKQMRADFREKM